MSALSHFTLLAPEDHVPGTFIFLLPTLLDVICISMRSRAKRLVH